MASRSYVPRHSSQPVRETRTTTARAAAALATTVGAAATAGTIAAAPADAATAHRNVWDKVASCESGNNWHIDTGNGYYGGLQFSSGTWGANGGHKYAGEANDASRAEQIEVARRVLKSQGPDAWPVCGPRAGLSKSNGHATSAKLPAHATDATAMSTSGSTSTGGVRADAKTKHIKKKHHAKKHTAAKRHRTKHKTRHASRGIYVVRRGDTLSAIANSHHVHGGWQAIYRANRSQLHNPNELRIGQHLTLP